MRNKIAVAAVLLQILVLAFMAVEREHIVASGREVFLRTAPIDPRDLFRGDYVRLNYEISALPLSAVQGDGEKTGPKKGDKMYAVLRQGPRDLAEFDYATDMEPQDGLFIRGRVTDHWRFRRSSRSVGVKYGIEKYFVQEGKGKAMERQRGGRNTVQVPLEMRVALNRRGTAVIKGHRWSSLGIGLEVVTSPDRNRNTRNRRRSGVFRLTLMNASDSPLALVDLPKQCSYFLEPVNWSEKSLVPDRSVCESIRPADGDVVVLNPQEKHTVDFDFGGDRWQVLDNGKPEQIGTLNGSEMYRIVYRPPSPEDVQPLKNGELVWHGYLPSRAFHGRGRID